MFTYGNGLAPDTDAKQKRAETVPKKPAKDKHLVEALTKAYTARARLFHEGVKASQIDLLIAEIDSVNTSKIKWNLKKLGITKGAFHRVEQSGAEAHQVFPHPAVIASRPHLVAYYRNLAAISRKGISQILFSTNRYENRKAGSMPKGEAERLCRVLNSILSGVIDSMPAYDISVSREAILAEIGAQLQGTWANMVGQGAAKAVERIIAEHLEKHHLGERVRSGLYHLSNGWKIVFGPEPDIKFVDGNGVARIGVEIKGSLDVAGAQTRYGEALKSFRKILGENPRCHTVYLASCFTDAVIDQIRDEGQVRVWYNLTSILADDAERKRFLSQTFHIVNEPT